MNQKSKTYSSFAIGFLLLWIGIASALPLQTYAQKGNENFIPEVQTEERPFNPPINNKEFSANNSISFLPLIGHTNNETTDTTNNTFTPSITNGDTGLLAPQPTQNDTINRPSTEGSEPESMNTEIPPDPPNIILPDNETQQ